MSAQKIQLVVSWLQLILEEEQESFENEETIFEDGEQETTKENISLLDDHIGALHAISKSIDDNFQLT